MRSAWLFFAFFARIAIPGRFVSLFYEWHSQSAEQIGIILSLPPLLGLVTTPLICHLADRRKSWGRVLIVTQVLATIAYICQLLALPSLNIVGTRARFPTLILVSAAYGIFQAPTYALITALSLRQLREEHGHNAALYFGRERLWGAVSWAACSLVLGALLDYVTHRASIVYTAVGVMSILFVTTIICFIAGEHSPVKMNTSTDGFPLADDNKNIPQQIEREQEGDEPKEISTSSIMEAIKPVLCNGGLTTALFFNLIFWLGVGMSVVENLLFLYFRDELRASHTLCGLTIVITVIFEVPLFAKADNVLQSLGAPALTTLGALAYVFRAIGYSLVPSAWWTLLLEPLHGVTFAAVHTASVSYVSERTAPHFEASAQAVLTFISGVGFAVGSAIGGKIIQHFGNRMLYRLTASMVLVATVAFGSASRFLMSPASSIQETAYAQNNLRHPSKAENPTDEGTC